VTALDTVWVFGDQLNRGIGALATARPDRDRILLVESTEHCASRPFHRQRLHLVLAGMRRLGAELAAEGFAVDHRRAPSLAAGLAAHRAQFRPGAVRATEPLSYGLEAFCRNADVALVRSDQFLCHRDEFASWARGRNRLLLEDFYRWQRRTHGYLMDGDEPVGGRWNLDADNRERPPKDRRDWPALPADPLDDVDRAVLADLPPSAVGADPQGWWATTRVGALERLERFVAEVLPGFGPYEDAMLRTDRNGANAWRLAHSGLSHALNVGLLLPGEVCDAVEAAYRAGRVPLASAEGFVRQVLGWREYVWGVYWLRMPGYVEVNHLDARRPLPPAFTGAAPTAMRCVAEAVEGIHERAWLHHIQRLVVLANLGTTAGVEPMALARWMAESFVDGAEWVMLPNVLGMGTFADGGSMSTKPYATGGAYLKRMSDYCSGCRFDPAKRTGPDACPFTTLYWDFLDRNRSRLRGNHRLAQPYANLDRLGDLDAVRARAAEVLEMLDAGRL
jgi:deoxyribodipyrimidine photolyase-related protein